MTLKLAAESGGNPLIPPIGELIIGTICFLALFGLLYKVAYPGIRRTLEERADKIEGGLQRAEEAQAEAQRTLEQYKQQLAEARQEAAGIREKAHADGKAIVDEARETARAEAQRIVDNARQQMDADRQQVVAQLRQEVGRLSTDLATRIVGESLEDEERQRRVVDRFLADLERERELT
ncbi:MAG: F0F1 ATP synthase subunit B [Streptosporangiales bacterium]|nr:F0F1 ATP synthase subunit B [Streptosporangiales bacterium]